MDKNKDAIITRMLHTANGLQIREKEDGTQSRTITGYAILFDTPSDVLWSWDDEDEREIIDRGAVTKELLDSCDIKMTMFHDRQLILARSNKGKGTLKYNVDDKGVSFEFDAPNTADGDKAIELVRRGDLAGCSFAFTTHYYDRSFVEPSVSIDSNGRTTTTYRVRMITGVYDFTLAADPAYPDTSCEARDKELFSSLREKSHGKTDEVKKNDDAVRRQIAEMREQAKFKL